MSAAPPAWVTPAQYAVAGAGLVVLGWWAWRARRGDDPLGPTPTGALPDTAKPLLVAIPAWAVASFALSAVARAAPLSTTETLIASGLLNVAVALALLAMIRRGAGERPTATASVPTMTPTMTTGRLAVAGLAAGLVTFGVVGLVGDTIQRLYSLVGAAVPEQGVVAAARSPHGFEAVAAMGTTIVLAPFSEEVFWRGALFPALARATSVRRALFLQAAAFGLIHVVNGPPAQWPIAVPLALVGWIAGWTYLRTGSLGTSVLVHVTFNAVNLVFIRLP